MTEFNYGAEPVAVGTSFKQASVDKHAARIRSIIHLGMFQEEHNGQLKAAAPEVVVVFELKDENDFEDDGVTPLTMSKAFPLRQGDLATLTKFMRAVNPNNTLKSFDDFIGKTVELDVVPSKKKNPDGTPQYTNIGTMSTLHSKLAAITGELTVQGVGHCTFDNLTIAAIEELNPYLEVQKILMKGMNYIGSKAEALIAEIRVKNPKFATTVPKSEAASNVPVPPSQAPSQAPTAPPAQPPAQLDANEEF